MSPTGYLRVGGAWVQSGLTGKANGVAFAPPGGPPPSYETIAPPGAPAATNAIDGPTYTMGIRFSLVAARPCYGARWRVPDSVATDVPSAGYQIRLWRVAGETPVATKAFNPVGFEGTELDILFDTPYASVLTGEDWIISVLTLRYVYMPKPGGDIITSPSGNIRGDEGRLATSTDPNTFPTSPFSSFYFLTPLIGL